jgi:flavin reductase (DIM6/NTAB) family NADH-FMN oxidoreductase RutF
MHKSVDLAIHYWGTPVVLISTLNEDGTANVAPMSSAWWLGWSCMLGLDASSKTLENLRRSRQCVLNLAAPANADAVNRLALLTGSAAVPLHKKLLGYRHEPDKFGAAGLTAQAARQVHAPRVQECPVQLEAVVQDIRPFAAADDRMAVASCAVEVRIVQAHVDESLLIEPDAHRVDPLKWRPLLMSFRQLFAMGDCIEGSKLARGPEDAYAPWKQGPIKALAGKALGAWTRHKYGA